MNRKFQEDFEKSLFTKVLLINSHQCSPILVLTTARLKPSQYIAQHLYEQKRKSNCSSCSSCSSHTSYQNHSKSQRKNTLSIEKSLVWNTGWNFFLKKNQDTGSVIRNTRLVSLVNEQGIVNKGHTIDNDDLVKSSFFKVSWYKAYWIYLRLLIVLTM